MSNTRRREAAGIVALVAALAVPLRSPASPAIVVVHPGALAGWAVVNTDPSAGASSDAPTARGTRGTFADGPAGAPLGNGSFRQVLGDAEETQRLQTRRLDGMRPSDVDDLSYATYVRAGAAATTAVLLVDLDADGWFTLEEDDMLVFDPLYQHGGAPGDAVPNQCAGVPGCVGRDVWQRWDAAAGGWWSYRAGTYGPPLVTLDHYQAQHPAARLAVDVPSLRLSAGGGGVRWTGYDAHLDDVRVTGVVYDLEAFWVLADCAAANDDVAEVQRAVDVAPPGYGVRLRGTCDFSAAAAHGGGVASIDAAAVVLRSNGPATDLAVEPEGAPGTAAVTGSGTQAAFFVPPGSSNVSISGIVFSNVGRAVVVADASDVTIGRNGAATPDPAGNRIAGGAGTTSAVLAVASGAPVTIAYGNRGERTATYTAEPAGLRRLTVAGNRIVYDTIGIPSATRHIAGVDVRQAGSAPASDVSIARNAIWFATGELRSFDIDGVRVQSLSAVPAISGVTIADNSIGRPEELGETAPPTSAGGRVGILVHRAAGVRVERNRVRAVLSTTPSLVPGAGILAAETQDAVIEANHVDTVVSVAADEGDLGAIGVVDDVDVLLAGAAHPAPSTGVVVERNTIGQASAHRGVLVDGSSWVDVRGNTIAASTGPAVALGAAVGALPRPVTTSVVCGNLLAGATDDPNEVSASQVTASNYPGGSLVPGNGECVAPSIAIAETDGATVAAESGGADTYTVALTVRPRSAVSVQIGGGANATVSPATLTFGPSDWASPQTVTVSAVQDTIPEGTHLQALAHTASSDDDDYDGTARTLLARILDDDPGSVLLFESGGSTHVVEGGATDTYTLVLGSRPGADVRISTAGAGQVSVSPSFVTFTEADWSVPRTMIVTATDDALREGPHVAAVTHRAFSTDANFDETPVPGIVVTVGDNDAPAAPIIAVPGAGSTIRTASIIVSGTGEAGATVDLAEGAAPLGSVVVPAHRAWSIGPLAFSEGEHTIVATQVDANGFRSAAATRTFRIDLTPPSAPAIVFPAEGAVLFDARIAVRGTAEPGSTVRVTEGALAWTAATDGAGEWSVSILFPAGPHQIVATVLDGAGNLGPSSPPRSFTINADGIAPDPPIVDAPAEGAIVPRTRTNDLGQTLPGFFVTGATEPGARVEVWEGAQPLGSGTGDANGRFSVGLSPPDSRTYRLSVRAIDFVGNRGAFAPARTVHVDGIPPTVAVRRPAGQVLITILPPGEPVNTFGVAGDQFGITRVEVRYTTRSGSTIVRDATICCENGGAVEWQERSTLAPGEYRVLAVAYDRAGNASRGSAAQILRL